MRSGETGKAKKARTLTFTTGPKRHTTISTETGYRTLSIIPLNPDNCIPNAREEDIIHELQKREIHISAIQETHIPRGISYILNVYRVIATESRKTNSENIKDGMYQGGVVILIHENLQHRIKQIGRIGRRVLEIILRNKNGAAPVIFLATYAPLSGRTVDEKRKHWAYRKKLSNK